jgi:hypothetical protein
MELVTHEKGVSCCKEANAIRRGHCVFYRGGEGGCRCFEDRWHFSNLIRMGWIRSCIIYKHTGVCYNERMLQRTVLSIKSGCYNEQRCYNDRGGMLFIMESSIIVFTGERCLMFMLFIRESLFIVFTKEILFMLFKFTCTGYRSLNKLILYYFHTYIFDFVLYFSCLNGCVGW